MRAPARVHGARAPVPRLPPRAGLGEREPRRAAPNARRIAPRRGSQRRTSQARTSKASRESGIEGRSKVSGTFGVRTSEFLNEFRLNALRKDERAGGPDRQGRASDRSPARRFLPT